jgi:glycosyltransferase involved in cell wall biosynthesis
LINKLKVCFLIAGFGQGGAQKQVILLMNELQTRKDIELHLIFSYEDVNFPDLEKKNIHLHQVEISSSYDPRNMKRVGKLLQKISPAIAFSWLHAFDVYMFFSRNYVPSCKWIVAERDSYYPFDLRYLLRKLLCVHADMIICNSDKGRLYWKKNNVIDKKLSVVSNILSIGDGTIIENVKGCPTVVFAGRFEAQKNVINIIKTFIKLAEVYPQGRFFLIGNGTLHGDLEHLLVTSGAKKQVFILPFKKNVADYFKAADVFVNVSFHEGMPNTVIENISKNNIVVVSKIDEHIKLLGSLYPYYVNNLEDVTEIAKVINNAIANNESIDCLKYAHKELANMSADKVAENYMTLFNRVSNA